MTKISILLPTRKRTDAVLKSLSSLVLNAAKPERLEIMIAIDEDDKESEEFFQSEEWFAFARTYDKTQYNIHQVPRWGYTGLFRYVNFLGDKSIGDYLMFWNDDALMHTQGWDESIDKYNNYFGVLRMQCPNHPHPFALFPIIPRKWQELFGCISLVAHSDWWIYNVCAPIGRVQNIPVEVFHDRADLTGGNNDETYNDQSYELDGRNPNHPDDYSHPQRRKDLEDWRNKLMLYGFPHQAQDDNWNG